MASAEFKRGISVLVLVAALMLLTHSVCLAVEGGIGAYLPGLRSFSTGIVPSKPGFYLRNDTIGYTATAPRVVLNGLPIENISVDIASDFVELGYVLPRKLFGANHAILLAQPLVWANLSGQIIGTDIQPSGKRFAPGDLTISPFYLGWHKGKLYYNTNLAIFAPTGSYDIHRVVNISRNYWALDPEIGVTYINPSTGWEISGALGYTINFQNPATKYTSGQVLHLDYVLGKALPKGLKPGIAGYAWMQVTPDTGPGAIFGSFESRVFGIGPAVLWQADKDTQLTFKYFHEFGATNRLEGDQFALVLKVVL